MAIPFRIVVSDRLIHLSPPLNVAHIAAFQNVKCCDKGKCEYECVEACNHVNLGVCSNAANDVLKFEGVLL